jgi:hypothetical protein
MACFQKSGPPKVTLTLRSVSGKMHRFEILNPEANPTIVSYNASAVKINNATSSLVRFQKNYPRLKKTS